MREDPQSLGDESPVRFVLNGFHVPVGLGRPDSGGRDLWQPGVFQAGPPIAIPGLERLPIQVLLFGIGNTESESRRAAHEQRSGAWRQGAAAASSIVALRVPAS